MAIKPESPLQVGEWQYLPEQDKLVQFASDGKIAVTADLDNLSQKVANYFIVNAGKLVTKDELLQDVWGIRDVSDGRVTRVIRVLRVALGDDTREPRYIETIPKRGYRFIAPVSAITEVEAVADANISESPVNRRFNLKYVFIALILLVLSIVSLVWFFQQDQTTEESTATIPMLRYAPLTSLDGLEFYHNLSNDERYLVYSYANPNAENITVLMLEDLKLHKRIQLTDESYNSFGATFSPDGKQVAYQRVNQRQSCDIRLITLDLDNFEPLSDDVLVSCGKGSVSSRLSWSPDGKYLVYPDMPDGEKQMSIHILSLNSLSVEKLTMPPISSFGDYSARFSRKGDKVAFLREGAGATQIWVVDLATRATKLLTKVIDAFPGNVDWGLNDEFILFPSSTSSISSVTLNGDASVFAYTDINASEIQITRSGNIVASVGYFSQISPRKVSNKIVNQTTVNEPVFNSNRNETFVEANPKIDGPLALVSKRSGLYQVWLLYADSTQKQLTNFTEPERIRGLVFSPNGSQLLVHLNQKILLYDLNGNYSEINGAAGAIIGVPSWSRDGQFIYYPEAFQGKWQLVRVSLDDLNARNIVAVEKVLYIESKDGKYNFWRDSNTKKFYLQQVGEEAIELTFVLPDTQVQTRFHLADKGIYFSKLVGELNYSLMFYSFADGSLTTVIDKMDLGRFSISADEKFVYILEYQLADIDIGIIEGAIETL